MKKKQFTILALVLVVVVVVAALILNRNRPYKPTSFVADGDNWSATVVDGSSIRLELNNNSKEWSDYIGTRDFRKRFSYYYGKYFRVSHHCFE